MAEEIEILNLLDSPQYLREVSEWIWNQWSKNHGYTLEDVIYRTKHSLSKNSVPAMYIAVYQEEVIGVVSIWRNDLNSRQDLFPWMSTLFVKEKYRNKGVGKKLQAICINNSRKLGYKNLYLITDHENYYEKMGWKFLEKAPLGDGYYTRIYNYELEDNVGFNY